MPLDPSNMCQCFFYLDDALSGEVCSMVMPVPPQIGSFIRVRMSASDEWGRFRIVSQTTDITRADAIRSLRYRFVVEQVK